MGDSEIKNEVVEKQNEPQKTAKTERTAKKKGGFFKALKAEFKRIVWPDKEKVIKETTAVVIVTILLGAIIALLDFVIKFGIDKIIQLG